MPQRTAPAADVVSLIVALAAEIRSEDDGRVVTMARSLVSALDRHHRPIERVVEQALRTPPPRRPRAQRTPAAARPAPITPPPPAEPMDGSNWHSWVMYLRGQRKLLTKYERPFMTRVSRQDGLSEKQAAVVWATIWRIHRDGCGAWGQF